MGYDIVEAAGSPLRIGQSLGEAAANSLHQISNHVEEWRNLKQRADRQRAARLLDLGRSAFPHMVEELEGVASGSGLPFEDIWLWNCRGDLRFHADSCTSLMIPGDPAIIAHNEDGAAELEGHCFIARIGPMTGPAIESFVYPGMLPGHTFAANASGIVQTINNIRIKGTADGLPRQFLARAVLECEMLDDALALFDRHERASGFHHNLGQMGDPRLISLEAPPGGKAIRIAREPFAHANHLTSGELADIPQIVTDSSAQRESRAWAMLAEGAGPCRILGDRSEAELSILQLGETGGTDSRTLATVIYEIDADRVCWAVHEDARDPACHRGSFTAN